MQHIMLNSNSFINPASILVKEALF